MKHRETLKSEVGEISIRGPTVFSGYDNAPDMNLEARLFQLTIFSRSTASQPAAALHPWRLSQPKTESKKDKFRDIPSFLRLFDICLMPFEHFEHSHDIVTT